MRLAAALLLPFVVAALVVDALSIGNDGSRSGRASPRASGQRLTVRLQRAHAVGARRSPRASLVQLSEGVAEGNVGSAVADARGPLPELLFGSLYVGLPPQEFKVAFDTGSGNLILPSKKCLSLACRSHKMYDGEMSAMSRDIARIDNISASLPQDGARETVRLLVGAGHLTGQLKSDRVCLGSLENLCAQTGIIDATEMSEYPFGVLPYDGIFGLGLPGSSLDKHFNLMGNLAEQGTLELDRFGVWFAVEGDDEDSEITFGATDESRMGSSTMLWKQLPRPESGLWELDLTDLEVRGARLNACGGGCRAAFDTGTSVIGGPSDFVDALVSRLGIADAECDMSSLPTIGFVLGDIVLRLEPSDYVKKPGAQCFHQFMKIDVPPPKGPIVLLGAPFFRRYYTAFDRVTLRLGFALSKHKVPARYGESSEDTAARLITQKGARGEDSIDA